MALDNKEGGYKVLQSSECTKFEQAEQLAPNIMMKVVIVENYSKLDRNGILQI